MADHVHYAAEGAAKVFGIQRDGVHQGQKRDPHRGYMLDGEKTSLGSIFGHAGIGCRRLARTRLPCADTSIIRRKKTNASNKWR